MKLKVLNVEKETSDSISIHFKQPFFNKIKYKPGQFLTLILDVDGKEVRRAYSINSTPKIDKTVTVTVKRVKDGKVSNRLFEELKPGDTLKVMKPMGNFVFEAAKGVRRHFVLFGGGSGITPLMSITKSILYFEPQSNVSLYYANLNEQSIIFKRQLKQLEEQFPDRFNLVHILEKPSPNWTGETGRINKDKIAGWINNMLPESADQRAYYICGPTGMMEVVQNSLYDLDIPEEKIHIESFTAPVKKACGAASEHQVAFVLNGKEHKVPVTPNKSILDAVLDEDIKATYSCLSGICGSCKSKLISGKIKNEEKNILSAEEKEAGYILPCVCFPEDDNVKIEMKS
ncbi:ferredoxin--NADP reductase [Cytophagaceae bacterium ABcell3]|nr:ferredoxin--NADP reductase [Cytophagaceae bacterium ABcell3]